MKGSCLCGQVAYEVSALDSPIQHCSCRSCRKAHGAAFNTSAAVKKSNFLWLRGELLLSEFESSPGIVRYFCSICGSQLIKRKDNSDHLALRVASLDEDPGQVPELRIWCSHEVPWLDYQSKIPRYSEWKPAQ